MGGKYLGGPVNRTAITGIKKLEFARDCFRECSIMVMFYGELNRTWIDWIQWGIWTNLDWRISLEQWFPTDGPYTTSGP